MLVQLLASRNYKMANAMEMYLKELLTGKVPISHSLWLGCITRFYGYSTQREKVLSFESLKRNYKQIIVVV